MIIAAAINNQSPTQEVHPGTYICCRLRRPACRANRIGDIAANKMLLDRDDMQLSFIISVGESSGPASKIGLLKAITGCYCIRIADARHPREIKHTALFHLHKWNGDEHSSHQQSIDHKQSQNNKYIYGLDCPGILYQKLTIPLFLAFIAHSYINEQEL